MVVDTKGTQHLLLFWQWPQIFGRYSFRETHGPSRILDGPIRCIFRHSCPFCVCILVFIRIVCERYTASKCWIERVRGGVRWRWYVIIEQRRKINTPKINIMLHKFRFECIMDVQYTIFPSFSVFRSGFCHRRRRWVALCSAPVHNFFVYQCNPHFQFLVRDKNEIKTERNVSVT